MDGRYLIISDLQMPFEHKKALDFCKYLVRHFKIDQKNIYCIGDETDQYWGSQWKKDINAYHTALSEIKDTKDRLAPWFDFLPILKLCTSNHGDRWKRKALESDIPEVLMRRYEEVLGCPQAWVWQKRWKVDCKHPFILEHGDRFGGQFPHVQAAMNKGISCVIGHHHTIAGVEHIKTEGFNIWGMCSGSLIDFEKFAFHYAREAKRLPQIGTSVVLDQGELPLWIPIGEA